MPHTSHLGRSTARRAALLTGAVGLALGTLAVPPAAAAVTYVVNSTADDTDGTCDALPGGDCTFREAIAAANSSAGADEIHFDLAGTGVQTISVLSDLPVIYQPVAIDGTTQPGYAGDPLVEIEGSGYAGGTGLYFSFGSDGSTVSSVVLNRFGFQNVLVDSDDVSLVDSYFGVNADASAVTAGASFANVRLRRPAANTLIQGNVLAGTGAAVMLDGSANASGAVTAATVTGNSIGVAPDGSPLGGGTGIRTTGAVSGNTFSQNAIANHSGLGIDLDGDGVTANDATDADTGPNGLQNFPELTGATTDGTDLVVQGQLDSTALGTFRLEFFAGAACDATGYGEGADYIGTADVVADSGGAAPFSVLLPHQPVDTVVTATATDLTAGETSEFSACETVQASTTPTPAPPGNVVAAAGDTTAQVRWDAADPNGGDAIDSYTVTASPADVPPQTVAGDVLVADVDGLTNGTSYTFTVSATSEAAVTSDPSAPSAAVTPQSGAADPETTDDEFGAGGGTVGTGTGTTTADDPTNTSITTTTPGAVSIAEGAMTNPDAGTYYGQQVDITAPDAPADDPMRFTFVTDCSVLPAEVTTCPAPSPLRTSSLAADTAEVEVRNGGYRPSRVEVDPGGTVTWSFLGSDRHSVTDRLGLGPRRTPLYDSGLRRDGTWDRDFVAAGTYRYGSSARGSSTSHRGFVEVPVVLSHPSAEVGDSVDVTWASTAPTGFRFDVQRRLVPEDSAPGRWQAFRTNVRVTSATYDLDAVGSYQFRARFENAQTGRATSWSPVASVAATEPVTDDRYLPDIRMFHEPTGGVNAAVPECSGADGLVQPLPSCVWSEEVLADGDVRIVVLTTVNGRWRTGS
jgi:CSLREA domain-containing protein